MQPHIGPHHLYFSAHHLARDLFWNTAIFTFFIILAAIFFPNFRDDLTEAVLQVQALNSTPVWVALFLAYVAIAVIGGTLSERLVAFFSGLAKYLPEPLARLRYEGWYVRNMEELKDFHDHCFGHLAKSLRSSVERPVTLMVRLTAFFRIYNPAGYIHVFRTYSFVGLARQCIAYIIGILCYSLRQREPLKSLVLTLLLLISFALLFHLIRHSVAREYAFLVATEKWLQTNLQTRKDHGGDL